jgi:hypothetical protein
MARAIFPVHSRTEGAVAGAQHHRAETQQAVERIAQRRALLARLRGPRHCRVTLPAR